MAEENIGKLFARIATITGKLGAIAKTGKHEQSYKYHSADDIMGHLNPLMAEHGLSVIPTVLDVATLEGKDGIERWLIRYEFIIGDADGNFIKSAWSAEAPMFGKRKDGSLFSDDKAMGKAHTYALKYFLMKLFMISTVDTDDLDTNHQESSKPSTKQAPKQESKAPTKPNIDNVDEMIGTTPPTLTEEQQFIRNLIEIVLPMCNHENHARNAVEKAIEDGAITKGDSLDKAAGTMLLRRMKSQWGLTEDESRGILPEALGVTMKEYLKANPRDYASIWSTLIARYSDMPV